MPIGPSRPLNLAKPESIDIRQADAVLVYSLIGYNKVELALSLIHI